MRPKRKEKTTKGLIEGFYVTEEKGKNNKRAHRRVLYDRSEAIGKVLNPNGGERELKVT
jgi:hypothetical protein